VVRLVNDRLATYPTHLWSSGGRFAFAPEVKGVLAVPGVRRTLDRTAMAQYVRFQMVLGQRTFFEDITLLPPATVTTIALDTGRIDTKPYWSFGDIPRRRQGIDLATITEEAGTLLRHAVERQSAGELRPGVYLSGGLDSRTLLGLTKRRPIHTITYGQRNARDVVYAAQIAQAEGSQHHWMDLPDGRWVEEWAPMHLALTEGYHSWVHAHGISTFEFAREVMDVNLSGWDGGIVLAFPENTIWRTDLRVTPDDLTTYMYKILCDYHTWPGLTEAEERLLYTPQVWRDVSGLAFDSMREELKKVDNVEPDLKGEVFYQLNHVARLTQELVVMYRSHIEMRFPFYDYKLIDLMYSLPPDVRKDYQLYRLVLERETPRLARIPWDDDESLPTFNRGLALMQTTRLRARRALGKVARSLAPIRPTLYADYENYLRHELRPWAENILFSPRAAGRGLFNMPFVHSLMNRHVAGYELHTIGKLAPLITFEMMQAALIDAPPTPAVPTTAQATLTMKPKQSPIHSL